VSARSEFETLMARYLGRRFAVAVTSGTAGILISLIALRPKRIIIPTFTFPSILAPIHLLRIRHRFVDIDPDTLNLHLPRNRRKYALIPHNFGLPTDARGALVEDACAALGGSYAGIPCGGMGKVSIISFNPEKIFPLGDGGMVLTDDQVLYHRVRALAGYGVARIHGRIDLYHPGLNLGMAEAVAREGVKGFPRFLNRVDRLRELRSAYLEGISGRVELPKVMPKAQPAPDQLVIRVRSDRIFAILERLRAAGFDATPLGTILPLIPYFDPHPPPPGASRAVREYLRIKISLGRPRIQRLVDCLTL